MKEWVSIFVLVLSSFTSISIFALDPFGGFYFGVHSGAIKGDASSNIITDADITGITTARLTSSGGMNPKSGVTAGLHMGYGKMIHKGYFGAEVFGSFCNHQQEGSAFSHRRNIAGTPYDETISNKTIAKIFGLEYGADFIPGYLVSPTTLLFGRVGVVRSKIGLSSDSDFTYRYSTNIDIGTAGANGSETKLGLRLGLGIKQIFLKNFCAGLSYVYTNYGNVSASDKKAIWGLAPSEQDFITINSKINMRTQVFLLSLTYNFL